ncbi:hypothetical protein, conserved [Trypanosoma brucei brucei TREU927]|uniref:tRNA ligase phosphodiesterase domain-containing protein n=1 Tax=Trypanosoma brucei brucei (strain 927/4 GUTat10.1) TaxID=185431 RepID=Q581X4_TRYB2|nr:hypothetical protein, conserved [Trypanosoma brucei brucei TREU927]AAX79429.1 hypothetical protein, conserved [Trypanosoma brucei]AAZ12975.1 hypothetical protein, conserved [Trypanosoma brucei brucei TREU927]
MMGCGGSKLSAKSKQADADPPKPSDPADAHRFERICTLPLHDGEKPMIFGAIMINDLAAVRSLVPADYLEGKNMQDEFHITTIYLGGKPPQDDELFKKLQTLEGTSIQVAPVRIASDAKATAIEIRNNNEFPCQNVHPHITIATAPGVPAKYSNELLSKVSTETSDIKVMELSPDVSISGVFQFVR